LSSREEDRQAILRASTMAELESSLENISVLDLLIVGERLGVDVDNISEKYLTLQHIELRNAIIEVRRRELPK